MNIFYYDVNYNSYKYDLSYHYCLNKLKNKYITNFSISYNVTYILKIKIENKF
jgi:hypothetical protein